MSGDLGGRTGRRRPWRWAGSAAGTPGHHTWAAPLGVALTPHLQSEWGSRPLPREGDLSVPWLRDLLPSPQPSPPRWRGFASGGPRPKQRVTATTLGPPHHGLGPDGCTCRWRGLPPTLGRGLAACLHGRSVSLGHGRGGWCLFSVPTSIQSCIF